MRESPIEFTPAPDMGAFLAMVERTSLDEVAPRTEVQIDSARLAQQIKHSGRRSIGVLPASPLDLVPLLTELACALTTLTDELVVVMLPERSAVAERGNKDATQQVYAAPLTRRVWALAPHTVAPPGDKDRGIRALLEFVKDRGDAFGQLLVDLSGCVRPGELLGSIGLLENFIVVGEIGKTTERDLSNVVRHLPQQASLGVLLVRG